MQILTLTLNPAFDIHSDAPNFAPYAENVLAVSSREAGGKGVNVSRALTATGEENAAVLVLGEENAPAFRAALRRDNLNFSEITVAGRIRENITLHTAGKPETRLSFSGFRAPPDLLDKVETATAALAAGDVLVLSGALPEGLPTAEAVSYLRRLAARGVKTAVDSRSFSRADLAAAAPFLIKPNREEASFCLGAPVVTQADARAAAEALRCAGAENVLLSLGADGAVLATAHGIFAVTPPRVTPLSTVGAGDSALAGFLAGIRAAETAERCLCRAVAYGTAACLTPGTRPPRPADVQTILSAL